MSYKSERCEICDSRMEWDGLAMGCADEYGIHDMRELAVAPKEDKP